MGFENIIKKRMENDRNRAIESQGKSIDEILTDARLSQIAEDILTCIEEKDEAEGKKMETIFQKVLNREPINDLEQADLLALREKILEISNFFDEIKKSNISKDIIAVHPYFAEVRKLVGLESIEKIIDDQFYIWLYLYNPTQYNDLKTRVGGYKNIVERVKGRDKELEALADKSGIPLYKIEEILETTDKAERDKKIKEVTEDYISGGRMRWIKNRNISSKLDAFRREGDVVVSQITAEAGNIGQELERIIYTSAEFKEHLDKRVSELITSKSPQEKEGVPFSEAPKTIELIRKKREEKIDEKEATKIREEWKEFRKEKMKEKDPALVSIDDNLEANWWRGLSDEDFKEYQEEFLKRRKDKIVIESQEKYKTQRGGFWSGVLNGLLRTIVGEAKMEDVRKELKK